MRYHPDGFVPPEDYIHLFGVEKAPSWFPGLSAPMVSNSVEFDATRDESGYGPASIAYAMEREPWQGRDKLILWALLRALLRQPGSLPMFTPEVIGESRWSRVDAIWVLQYTPLQPETVHLILRALECVPALDVPIVGDIVTRVRSMTDDPALHERLDVLDAKIADAPNVDDIIDPRLLDRVPGIRHQPIMELFRRCPMRKPERITYYMRDVLRDLAAGLHDHIRLLLLEIPGHLAEHGEISHGEDVLRGLIMLELELKKDDLSMDLREIGLNETLCRIILAADATRPLRAQKLANAAVTVLYYKDKTKPVLRRLRDEVQGKRLKARVIETIKYTSG